MSRKLSPSGGEPSAKRKHSTPLVFDSDDEDDARPMSEEKRRELGRAISKLPGMQ